MERLQEAQKTWRQNISPVSSFKRCLGFQSHSLSKNIFQKYPPENFLRPPRCRGGAVSAPPPYTFGGLETFLREGRQKAKRFDCKQE